MLAAIKALEGHKVDVVTSSPELAKPQAREQKEFFQHFGLTVSDNGKDNTDIRQRYRSDIVYGAAGDFQGDILRDEYNKLGTRSGRKCDVAIVDEVDLMLIDGKNHIVMLSAPMPAMDHLEPLLAVIWIQIELVAKSISEIDGKAYFIQQENLIDDNDKLKKDIVDILMLIEGTKEKFIKDCTEKFIRSLLLDVENSKGEHSDSSSKDIKLRIPVHLREFVSKSQLPKWIDSAIYAKYRCEYQKHYILKNGKVAPVDANNTGIVQQNMHWSNGLHQFLQIKHSAKISAESLTTNFISNVTYFRRYNKHIYGLTGTLGSSSTKTLLNKAYNVDCVIIPPFRQKQYRELTSIIVNSHLKDWYDSIAESCINKLKNGRGVLVITKYIKEVDELKYRLIQAGYDSSKIKVYKTEDDSIAIREDMKPGEIINATNIAGRGTDIKASKIERNGGLHVCITFLPPNERVEQQNVGRTSRKGNKGTSQFILLEKNEYEFNILRQIRSRNEEDELEKAETKIKKVTINDAVFAEFCKLLDDINDNSDASVQIKSRAVEDRFGIWLKMQEDNISKVTDEQKILEEFEHFKQKILQDKASNRLIRNPYFYVLIGNDFLHMKEYQEAIDAFTQALELDRYFQANAYYNRGYARIAEYGGKAKKNRHEIDKAIEDFKKAKEIINDEMEPMLHVIQKASNSEALSEQVDHKMTLFRIQKNAIEMAIGADVNQEIKDLENQRGQPDLSEDNIKAINERIENLKKNKEDREKGIIKKALDKGYNLAIELEPIEKSLPEDQDVSRYTEELLDFRNNGYLGSFNVKEVKPICWWSVIAVLVMGLIQIVGGEALAVLSLGAASNLGMGFISEGVGDLIVAIKDGIINKDFDWTSYGIQKAISFTVSLVCAGLGAIKDAAKTIASAAKQIGTIVAKIATQSAKEGWKLAAKAIGVELAKGVGKELVTQLVDYGVDKCLIPDIHEEIRKRIEGPIQDALVNNKQVENMLRLDGNNRNRYYESLIKQKAMQLLEPQNDPEHALWSIAKGIAMGIATSKIKGLSAILKTAEALQALQELSEFVPKFIERLDKTIEKIARDCNINRQLKDLDKESTKIMDNQNKDKFCKTEEELREYSTADYIQDQSDDINLNVNEKQEEQVELDKTSKSPEVLRQQLAESVSMRMSNIIQSKLVTPITNAGIDFTVKKLTSSIDKSIQKQIGDRQAERRIAIAQDGDKFNRIGSEFKHGIDDPKAVKKADEMIDDLKKGGEASLPHLGSLSDATGRRIKVLDEKGRVIRIIGDDKGGEPIEVQYHKPSSDNSQGHWSLPGGVEPAVNNSGKNNCLFNVVAQQTGKDPNQLRMDTVERMSNNKALLANQAYDIVRLEQNKKYALTMGGVRSRGQNIYLDDDEVDEIVRIAKTPSEYGRTNAPGFLDVIPATDNEGRIITISKHHMIPEEEIRKEFTKLVEQYPNDRNGLKTALNRYLNHPNNKLGRQAFMNSVGIQKGQERNDNTKEVAFSYLSAVSWHPNNLRLGPVGQYRTDDPEAPGSRSKLDYAVADPKSKIILDEYSKKRRNILDTQNRLPDNVSHYGWRETRNRQNRKYEVDQSIRIGKLSRFLRSDTGYRVTFNPFRPRGDRQFQTQDD
ncbi:unnamed protein product [Rotaria sp. Silwood2]|nr:unnamed protein product [Rotaria sp. Silwood2]